MKIIFFLLLSTAFVDYAYAIKKCQDENGKWHYGDIAVEACENTKVTTLNNRGFVTEELEAPKTEAELLAEKKYQEEVEAEELRKKNIEEEHLRILSIYETEDDIDRQRNNQMNSVQSNIDVHNAYLKSMDSRIKRYEKKQSEVTSKKLKQDYQTEIEQSKVRVENSKKELAALKKQKDDIMSKFAEEKRIYLAIKDGTIEAY